MQQPELFTKQNTSSQEETERQVWLEKLRRKLQDPEFRKIPGFPIGSDEAILALSDPPYYTACPNPFLPEILEHWREERRQLRAQLNLPSDDDPDAEAHYHRDPFAADVSEGKNDPIYNAHSYHTKVPHKAVMRYILHYTDPGDIVFDGFCGSGMTGVAAQLCGDKKAVESLGYYVDEQGVIWDGDQAISRLGARKAVLVDLSPAATFIAYNYNTPVDARAFEREAKRILDEVEKECGWMYETLHTDGKTKGRINYTVWSDVFICPQCGGEMVFWDVAVDLQIGEVRHEWDCPHCRARLSKSPRKGSGARRVERAFETKYDRAIGQTIRQAKQVPVLINYSVGKRRYEKRPDEDDLALLEKIECSDIPHLFPTQPMMFIGENWGDTWRAGIHAGLTHVHHFYTRRNLWVLVKIHYAAKKLPILFRLLIIDSIQSICTSLVSKLTRYKYKRSGNSMLPGTLYIASTTAEQNVINAFYAKIDDILTGKNKINSQVVIIQTSSSSTISITTNELDYIFVDPPFGANLMYSELNFLWEAWLGVFTNNQPEAVINKTKGKGLPEYQALMEACFREFYRLLKPGRWMTVEFHNSQNAVWNAIQEALLRAGFMVADVRIFNKLQGTFNQVTTAGAVKKDLIISAYKPPTELEQRFSAEGGSMRGAWEFVQHHLEQLAPPTLKEGGAMEFIEERAPYLLYDRMVAFHVQRGLPVPLSAAEFYAGLRERFAERDGMFFTYPQAAAYDRLRLQAERVEQLSIFVTDEKSAIQWLRRELGEKPQTYQELHPKFTREVHQVSHEDMPELRKMLEENFLQDEAGRWYLPDPSKESDLQALRERTLLREFSLYVKGKGKLKAFRSEAVRAGFSRAWKERQYETILQVAQRLPERALQEDPQLLMYVDNARLRASAQPRQERLL